MRQAWRGKYRGSSSEPEAEEDDRLLTAREILEQASALGAISPPKSSLVSDLARSMARLAARGAESFSMTIPDKKKARSALRSCASLARRVSDDITRASRRMPWPIGGVARSVARIAETGAERIDPTPHGASAAGYLSATLRLLAASPQRIALREAAVEYANDLFTAIPANYPEHADAEQVYISLDALLNGDNSKEATELEEKAAKLRPGSAGRAVVEQAAADARSRMSQSVLWRGSWTSIADVRDHLNHEADFWAAYVTGERG